ncbi:MAG: ATP-binding protein [Legionella sp.]
MHFRGALLDDLQWADNSSLNIIENLLSDNETNSLLIIGAYHDNEVSAHHPLQLWINRLNKNKINLHSLMLKPLRVENIQELLYDSLHRSKKIPELAQCIFTKTHGNPFFINQFLQVIHQQDILTFSYEHGVWEWDLPKVEQQSPTDNVIDLLSSKIHLLPPSSQGILKLASCFGHQFTLRTLQIISGQPISQIAEQLGTAIAANIIYPQEESYRTLCLVGVVDHDLKILKKISLHYRFAHDRIQQAVYELIKETEKPAIHLQIGRLLLKDKLLTQHDKRLFEVLRHFNHSISLIHDASERLQLAQYNLWAGQKAKMASAHDVANQYLSAGIKFLKPITWEEDYDLALQLHKEIAICKYLMGNIRAANKYFYIALRYTKNALDEVEVHCIKMEMLAALGKHEESLQAGLDALQSIGVKIPKTNLMAHLLFTVFKITLQLKKKKIESLTLPLMTDPKQIAIGILLTQLCNSVYFVNPHLSMLMVCMHFSISLKYGYTESAIQSTAFYICFVGSTPIKGAL